MPLKTLLSLLCIPLLSHIACGQSIERRSSDVIPEQLESMYTQGLQYLSTSQNADGSWSDRTSNSTGITGLATLAFLAHGEDPNHSLYSTNIKAGIDFLITSQQDNGYIGTSMYNHGFATLALAECYGALHDSRLEQSLNKAVALILSAQTNNAKGGWRYSPEANDADTTVSGCQIVALLAARNAGIPVPDAAIKKGLDYLSSCRNSSGSYGYTSRNSGKPTLTAIGSLCFSLAKQKDAPGYQDSLAYLKKNLDYRDSHYTFYFMYYMSQALFQADEESWKSWNEQHIRLLAASQQADGSWAGQRGRSYTTASALLSVALNYRFLPIYEK